MSDQDAEGLASLMEAITKAAATARPGPNHGRIYDGIMFITDREWDSLKDEMPTQKWNETSMTQRLTSIPLQYVDGMYI